MKPSQCSILARLLNMPENARCSDCNQKHPKWASTTLGVFICIRCAGTNFSRNAQKIGNSRDTSKIY